MSGVLRLGKTKLRLKGITHPRFSKKENGELVGQYISATPDANSIVKIIVRSGRCWNNI